MPHVTSSSNAIDKATEITVAWIAVGAGNRPSKEEIVEFYLAVKRAVLTGEAK